jgi:hypothetical protein
MQRRKKRRWRSKKTLQRTRKTLRMTPVKTPRRKWKCLA